MSERLPIRARARQQPLSDVDSASLALELAGAAPARRARGDAANVVGWRALAYWLPVALPLALFCQIALIGLKAGARESARLERAEAVLSARYESELERGRELDRTLTAQRDPIYLERERRLLFAKDSLLRKR